jgi:hypothetical protein
MAATKAPPPEMENYVAATVRTAARDVVDLQMTPWPLTYIGRCTPADVGEESLADQRTRFTAARR